jgi:hypothetical protein
MRNLVLVPENNRIAGFDGEIGLRKRAILLDYVVFRGDQGRNRQHRRYQLSY